MNGLAGTLVLVVGPSGAGKDSVIDEARKRLIGNGRYVFAVRSITRAADAGGEFHESLTEDQFEARRQAGGFLLSWQAHGLSYGIPAAYLQKLEQGCIVIANVSRLSIEEARAKCPGRVRVVAVTAPRDVLAERLARRGRETQDEIRERLARTPPFIVDGPGVWELKNDGPLKEAGNAFADFLEQL